jgi:hypothetical protein
MAAVRRVLAQVLHVPVGASVGGSHAHARPRVTGHRERTTTP